MSNREFEDFMRHLSGLIPDIRRQILKHSRGLLTVEAVSLPQMTILEYLYNRKSCIMSDIAKFLSVSMSAATGLVDRMIKNGLLKRNRSLKDRRTVTIILTGKGKRIAKSFLYIHRKMLRKIFEKISATDRKKYLEIIGKIHTNLMAA